MTESGEPSTATTATIADVVVARSEKGLQAVAAATGVTAYFLVFGAAHRGAAFLVAAVVAAVTCIFAASVSAARRNTRHGTLTLRDGVLYLGERLLAPVDRLRDPALLVTARGAFLSLKVGSSLRSELNFSFADRATALRAMAMMGVDVARATTVHKVRVPDPGKVWAALIVGILWASRFGQPLVALGLVALAMLVFNTARVVVGADGVLVKWLGGRTRYRLADIDRVEVGTRGIFLFLEGKRTVEVKIARDPMHVEKRRLAERITEAIEAHVERPPIDGARLARGERPVEKWIAELRLLVGGEETFRSAAMSARDLLAVVVDGRRPEIERAAAAAAVARHLDVEDRERLRIAAQTTVSPKLRVALESAASDDEAGLGDALAELEKDEAKATKELTR